MDLNIKTKRICTISNREKQQKKHFNEILNEIREHKENMLPLPDLEEEAHQP